MHLGALRGTRLALLLKPLSPVSQIFCNVLQPQMNADRHGY